MVTDIDKPKFAPPGAADWEAPQTDRPEEPQNDGTEPQTEEPISELPPEEIDLQKQVLAISDPQSLLQFNLNFDSTEWQNKVSQETVGLMLDKILDIAEISKKEQEERRGPYRSPDPGFQLQHQIDLYKNFFQRSMGSFLVPGERTGPATNITDRAFSTIVNRIKAGDNIIPLCSLLEDELLHNSQLIRADVLMEGTKELFWLDDSQLSYEDAVTLSMMEDALMRQVVSYGIISGEGFQQYLDHAEQLNPDDTFTETAKLLTLLRKVWRYSKTDISGYDSSSQQLAASEAVERISTQSTNYFIKAIAGATLQDMARSRESGYGYDWGDRPQIPLGPQEIAPQIRGTFSEAGLTQISRTDESKSPDEIEPSTPFSFYLGSGKGRGREYREIKDNELYGWIARFSPGADREQINSNIQSFRLMMNPAVLKALSDELGVNLNTVDLETQFYLMTFLRSKPKDKIDEVATLAKEYGKDFLTCFLSTGFGQEMGEHILAIAEEAEPEVTKKIFSRYAETVDQTRKIGAFIKNALGAEKAKEQEANISAITTKLLGRGRDILAFSREKIDNPQEIIQRLDSYNILVLSLGATLKTAHESGRPIEIHDLEDLEFTESPGSEIPEKDRDMMRQIAKSNWTEAPDPNAPEATVTRQSMQRLAPVVMRGLEEGFTKQDNEFYVLRFEGQVVGFLRFEHTPDGLYFGSFNVDPNARGSTIGEQMSRKIIDEKAEDTKIIASCSPMQDITGFYISKKGGFVAEGITLDAQSTGEPLLNIRRDDKANQGYFGFLQKPDEIVSLFESGTLPPDITVLKQNHLNPEEYQQFLHEAEAELAHHPDEQTDRVMTAFFQYPKGSFIKYAVFEPRVQAESR